MIKYQDFIFFCYLSSIVNRHRAFSLKSFDDSN